MSIPNTLLSTILSQRILTAIVLLSACSYSGNAQSLPANESTQKEPFVLPIFNVVAQLVANEASGSSFDMPISSLALDPRVDVQGRGFAEGCADIAIRGGTFESVNFQIGALSIYDPQTGHYLAELPVDPMMLGVGMVRSGAEQAMEGWNSTAASIGYNWRQIRNGGQAVLGAGEDDFRKGQWYLGKKMKIGDGKRVFGADVSLAHSQSDGSLPHSDHKISRYNARLQILSENSQSDFFVGYQKKFIALQNLYAGPFNSFESDELKTFLAILNHRLVFKDEGGWMQAGIYYRRNDDHYQYNRFAPNRNYAHRTQVWGAAVEGSVSLLSSVALRYRGGLVSDKIESSSLIHGHFNKRTQGYAGAWAEKTFMAGKHEKWVLSAGAVWDESSRDGSALSPLVKMEWYPENVRLGKIYFSYSESTQLPSYTALNSSRTSGIWRGNADLGRSKARNWEIGAEGLVFGWKLSGAFFVRQDRDLVDWTYDSTQTSGAARWANPVDIDTYGLEFIGRKSWSSLELVLGYSALRKHEDWGAFSGQIDASFYALNFPEHRLTLAAVLHITKSVELRMDNEGRIQKGNALRESSDKAVISALGLYWQPVFLRGVSFSARVDNLWDRDFEEVPLVPVNGRTFSISASYAW